MKPHYLDKDGVKAHLLLSRVAGEVRERRCDVPGACAD